MQPTYQAIKAHLPRPKSSNPQSARNGARELHDMASNGRDGVERPATRANSLHVQLAPE
jgi:hypothetical protein